MCDLRHEPGLYVYWTKTPLKMQKLLQFIEAIWRLHTLAAEGPFLGVLKNIQ